MHQNDGTLFLHAEDQVTRCLHSLDEDEATVTDEPEREEKAYEIKDMASSSQAIYLKTSMICYVCKKEVKAVHHFYDQVGYALRSRSPSVVRALWGLQLCETE